VEQGPGPEGVSVYSYDVQLFTDRVATHRCCVVNHLIPNPHLKGMKCHRLASSCLLE
jgi:hypothetical protein